MDYERRKGVRVESGLEVGVCVSLVGYLCGQWMGFRSC